MPSQGDGAIMNVVRFALTDDVHEFARRARALLASRIEWNLHATVVQNVVDGRYDVMRAVYAYGLDDRGELRFAALRTPPWFMLATELEPGSAPRFIERWLAADPEVPGVNGLPKTARAIAAAWSEYTGGTTYCRMREAIHVLDRVSEQARPAPGELRVARSHERQLLLDWIQAFSQEAGVLGGDQAREIVDAQLARNGLFVWDDGGPVSMAATSPAVSGVVRVGPVYTPPEQRRRGYATSMVAAISRQALSRGADQCMLFTDLANPTSNKIYAEVGYRRIGEWEEHAFEPR